jgi:hypothetical protein
LGRVVLTFILTLKKMKAQQPAGAALTEAMLWVWRLCPVDGKLMARRHSVNNWPLYFTERLRAKRWGMRGSSAVMPLKLATNLGGNEPNNVLKNRAPGLAYNQTVVVFPPVICQAYTFMGYFGMTLHCDLQMRLRLKEALACVSDVQRNVASERIAARLRTIARDLENTLADLTPDPIPIYESRAPK